MLTHFLSQAEQDLKLCEERFNKQVEITKLLLEGISSAQVRSVFRLKLRSLIEYN